MMEIEEETTSLLPPFQLQKRRSLIVFVYSLKQMKLLRKFGFIQYVSRRMKYVVIYMDEEVIDETIAKIEKLHFVRQVEKSYRPDIEMNFADRIGTKAAYQVKDDELEEIEETKSKIRLANI